MSIKFTVDLTDNSELVRRASDEAIERALEAVGLQAEKNVKLELRKPKLHANGRKKPTIDTGRLINSISHEVKKSENAVYVGTNVEYAAYVEMGTRRSRAYPYLRPGIEDHLDEYKRIIETFLKAE